MTIKLLPCTVALLLLSWATAQEPRPLWPPLEVHPPTPLFNGKDLSGWWGLETEDPRAWQALPPEELAEKKAASLLDIHKHWRVENGELVNDGSGLYLSTEKNYGDFCLSLEYKTVAGADSGVYLRGCPQVQIWDTTEAGGKWSLGAHKGSGGLWNNTAGAPGKDPLVKADKPFGKWNLLWVIMVGERVSVRLNSKLVVDHARLENYYDRNLPLPRSGPIELQAHGGEIRWRNLNLIEFESEHANGVLANSAGDGFESLFNGADLSGWAGALDEYEIADDAIRCKPGRGGTLYTRAEYGDFAARLLFKLPKGGNNGLAIRYPGDGDPAYAGMCELQVLDSEDPKYAGLDPRQFHGSVYGQVAAQRGYLRKSGEWNFQEVTVVGPRITVELNGTRILDSDLSAVTDCLYPLEKFAGRNRKSGHFGFAGHNDAVEFRDIEIKHIVPEAKPAGR